MDNSGIPNDGPKDTESTEPKGLEIYKNEGIVGLANQLKKSAETCYMSYKFVPHHAALVATYDPSGEHEPPFLVTVPLELVDCAADMSRFLTESIKKYQTCGVVVVSPRHDDPENPEDMTIIVIAEDLNDTHEWRYKPELSSEWNLVYSGDKHRCDKFEPMVCRYVN